MKRWLPISYSQNFLISEALAAELIRAANYNDTDTVIEIGAGKGMLSKHLAASAGKVFAFEVDPYLYKNLQDEYKIPNLSFISLDFLKADLERYGKFKVFANIPFFLTSAIVQKLLFEIEQMQEARLFMEQDTAYRFMGAPFANEGILPLLIKPFWDLKIIYRFSSTDFKPEPQARIVLLKLRRKSKPDIPVTHKHLYFDFIAYLINLRKSQIKNALLQLFTFDQLKIISKNIPLSLSSKPTDLTYQQWLKLFETFLVHCPEIKRVKLIGAYAKIQRHQHKLNKDKKINY